MLRAQCFARNNHVQTLSKNPVRCGQIEVVYNRLRGATALTHFIRKRRLYFAANFTAKLICSVVPASTTNEANAPSSQSPVNGSVGAVAGVMHPVPLGKSSFWVYISAAG